MEFPIHAIRFSETNEFSKRFNYVGKLFDRATDTTLSEDKQNKWWDEYASAKYCLEQGLPIEYLNLDL